MQLLLNLAGALAAVLATSRQIWLYQCLDVVFKALWRIHDRSTHFLSLKLALRVFPGVRSAVRPEHREFAAGCLGDLEGPRRSSAHCLGARPGGGLGERGKRSRVLFEFGGAENGFNCVG